MTKIEINLTQYEYLCGHFPEWDIKKFAGSKENLLFYTNGKFNQDNIVGAQQLSWVVFNCIKEFKRSGGIGIDIGAGQQLSPFCVGLDYYSSDRRELDGEHPDYYSGEYHPHLKLRGDVFRDELTNVLEYPLKILGDNTFNFLVSHHSLEHMENTLETLQEWIRIIKPGGALIIVMPDNGFISTGDKGHKNEYSAENFRLLILDKLLNLVTVEKYDTLQNNFSFNCLLRKK